LKVLGHSREEGLLRRRLMLGKLGRLGRL